MGLWDTLARADGFRKVIPAWVRSAFRHRLLGRDEYLRALWSHENPWADVEEESSYPAKHDVTLGIIREFTQRHHYFVSACRDLGVPYKLLDITGPDWIDVIESCGCDAFLAKPPALLSIWKQMFDERMKIITDDLHKLTCPTFEEVWFYESKRRMHYWLNANAIPHPKTWVFYDRQDAMRFVEHAPLPIVYKSDLGAAASGVRIFRNRGPLRRWVNRCFKRGIVRKEGHPSDRQWGSVLLQEYCHDAREWRMVRIGESYFGHLKLKQGEFHSGSGQAGWEDPPTDLLDFTRDLTERGGFTSMAVDVFATLDNRYLVNELQTVFGFAASRESQMIVGGRSGRYVLDTGEWRFEAGDFSSDGCYKLRVETLLETLKRRRQQSR